MELFYSFHNFLQLFATFCNNSQMFAAFCNILQLFATIHKFSNILSILHLFTSLCNFFTTFYFYLQLFAFYKCFLTFHNLLQLFLHCVCKYANNLPQYWNLHKQFLFVLVMITNSRIISEVLNYQVNTFQNWAIPIQMLLWQTVSVFHNVHLFNFEIT